jgi:hypothetical protein
VRLHLNGKKLGVVAHTCHHHGKVKVVGSWSRLAKSKNPISKINRTKRSGDLAQVVGYLTSKCETLSSNPSTPKHKKLERPPSQSIRWVWWHVSVVPAMRETIGRRTMV